MRPAAGGGRSGSSSAWRVSFTFATVALVYVISALGLPNDLLRKLAIAVLLAFGVTLMIPPLAARVEAWMSRFAGRAGVAGGGGDGFWSGTAVGASLGLVYAPCAGPILAGVITVSASQPFTAGRLAVALSYGIGSAVVLYFLMLGGRQLTAPLARRGAGLQIAMGAVMVVVALAMAAATTTSGSRTRSPAAAQLPGQPDRRASRTRRAAQDRARATCAANRPTASARRRQRRGSRRPPERRRRAGASRRSGLPVLGAAPEFVGNQQWFNTPGGKPLTLRELRGRVVLVDFWTYSCINCLRTLPYLTAWDRTYRKDGLTIVGVHSPEFPFEKDAGNVEEAIERNGIRLSGRPGQRPGDLERLRQPVLALRVLHRRPGPGPLRPLRRGRIRREGADHPRAARRSRPRRSASSDSGRARRSKPRRA